MAANPRNLSQVLGTTRSWQVTATYQGNPILGKYVAGDNLTASIWQGQDQTVLLTPSVTWIVPSLATINLTITAAQLAIAGLAPGVYHLQVDVTPLSDSQPRCVYYGLIQFDPTRARPRPSRRGSPTTTWWGGTIRSSPYRIKTTT